MLNSLAPDEALHSERQYYIVFLKSSSSYISRALYATITIESYRRLHDVYFCKRLKIHFK